MRKMWIEKDSLKVPLRQQLDLLSISNMAYYYVPVPETEANLLYMELIDREYTKHPFYGSRRMGAILRREGHIVNRKRLIRLMRLMGLQAIYPKPNLSKGNSEHKKYPYLLRDLKINEKDHVWSTDITYIPVQGGFLYLIAVIDWATRYVLSWRISNTLDLDFCIDALEAALSIAQPLIFNTDQGSQFTSNQFTNILENKGIAISMDGKGRALDNIFVERLWRSVKYEEVYIKRYETGSEAYKGIQSYMKFYNTERPHQALDYKTPQEVYYMK